MTIPDKAKYPAAAILLSAERGEEMKTKRPLCFIDLDHKPLFVQAVDHLAASKRFHEVILLLHEEWVGLGTTTAEYWQLEIVRHILAGSSDQMETLRRGMMVLRPGYEVTAIHDGARPLPPPELVAEVTDMAYEKGFAVPVRPVDGDESIEDRDRIIELGGNRYGLQSPIGVNQEILRELMVLHAEKKMTGHDLTDLALHSGITPEPVITSSPNPKVTVPADLERCMNVLRERSGKGRIR